jgi:hypothetical protein
MGPVTRALVFTRKNSRGIRMIAFIMFMVLTAFVTFIATAALLNVRHLRDLSKKSAEWNEKFLKAAGEEFQKGWDAGSRYVLDQDDETVDRLREGLNRQTDLLGETDGAS